MYPKVRLSHVHLIYVSLLQFFFFGGGGVFFIFAGKGGGGGLETATQQSVDYRYISGVGRDGGGVTQRELPPNSFCLSPHNFSLYLFQQMPVHCSNMNYPFRWQAPVCLFVSVGFWLIAMNKTLHRGMCC